MSRTSPIRIWYTRHTHTGVSGWQRLLFILLLLFVLLLAESVIITLVTGHRPSGMASLLLENIDFFLLYFADEPLQTLKFILLDKPLFVIEARQSTSASVIWGMHYYAYTVVAHIVIAWLLLRIVETWPKTAPRFRLAAITGLALLLFSCLYLYLSSCCTGGANWILHTGVLAIVLNPYMTSGKLMGMYELAARWFDWFQLLFAVSGGFLLARYWRKVPTTP